MGFQNFIKILIEFTSFKIYIIYIYIVLFCLHIKFASYVMMIWKICVVQFLNTASSVTDSVLDRIIFFLIFFNVVMEEDDLFS